MSCAVPRAVHQALILPFVIKMPKGTEPDVASEDTTPIAIPDSTSKPAEYYGFHLTPRGKLAVEECCKASLQAMPVERARGYVRPRLQYDDSHICLVRSMASTQNMPIPLPEILPHEEPICQRRNRPYEKD